MGKDNDDDSMEGAVNVDSESSSSDSSSSEDEDGNLTKRTARKKTKVSEKRQSDLEEEVASLKRQLEMAQQMAGGESAGVVGTNTSVVSSISMSTGGGTAAGKETDASTDNHRWKFCRPHWIHLLATAWQQELPREQKHDSRCNQSGTASDGPQQSQGIGNGLQSGSFATNESTATQLADFNAQCVQRQVRIM